MRTVLSLLLLSFVGCSLIIGNKLDDKARPDGGRREGLGPAGDGQRPDGSPRDDLPPPPTTVKGELGNTGKGPYRIGERIEVPVWKHPTSAALQVTIGPKSETSIPCVGGRAGHVFACTVSALTPDGASSYFVKDERAGTGDAFAVLSSGPIEITRLVASGSSTTASVQLFAQASLKDEGKLSIPGTIARPPKVSPSGRYLLAEHASGMALADLVRGVVVKLPSECRSVEGSAFEPTFEMLKATPKTDPFFFFRPERALYCSGGGPEAVTKLELPEPPTLIGGTLKATKLDNLRGVVRATSFADLAGAGWLAGITDLGGKREVFAMRIGASPVAISLDQQLVPEQVVVSALEDAPGLSLKFAKSAYLVVRVKNAQTGARSAVLVDPAGKVVHQLDLLDLQVEDLVWVTYTNLVALARAPGSNPNLAYLRLARSASSSAELQLVQYAVKSPLPAGAIQAFPFTFVDSVLFTTTYNRRFGQLAGNRILVYADGSDKAIMDASVASAAYGTVKLVVAHPVDERLLVLTDKRLIAFKLGNLLTPDPLGASIALAADSFVIQP